MSENPARTESDEVREQQAAAWVLRSDRGLSPAEQDEFFQWLAADPRNGACLARHRRYWSRLDKLAEWCPEHGARPNPDLLAPPAQRPSVFPLRRTLAWAAVLAVAAALALSWPWFANSGSPPPAVAELRYEGRRVLEDGSIIELNEGAVVDVAFTAAERHVRLEQGEAYFDVAKDPGRPFVVSAQGVAVRAVGTAFNVRLEAGAVEVLVKEGRVQVDASVDLPAVAAEEAPASPEHPDPAWPRPLLEARQRAVISLAPQAGPPQIATLTTGEVERVLAWQHRLLDFTATPIDVVIAEFNRRNVVQISLADEELATVPISVTFRSDNINGFVRLLETGFGVKAESPSPLEIILRKVR